VTTPPSRGRRKKLSWAKAGNKWDDWDVHYDEGESRPCPIFFYGGQLRSAVQPSNGPVTNKPRPENSPRNKKRPSMPALQAQVLLTCGLALLALPSSVHGFASTAVPLQLRGSRAVSARFLPAPVCLTFFVHTLCRPPKGGATPRQHLRWTHVLRAGQIAMLPIIPCNAHTLLRRRVSGSQPAGQAWCCQEATGQFTWRTKSLRRCASKICPRHSTLP